MEIVSIHLGQAHETPQFFTIGLHPWWTSEGVQADQEAALKAYCQNAGCLALGEMGLDKLKGPTMNIQMEVLRSQLRLASAWKKPVVIHCVRAYDQLLQIKKEFPDISRWCIHGFGRNRTLAAQLIAQGFYLSFMPSSVEKYADWFNHLRHDRLFLETDSSDKVTIEQIYARVSNNTGLEIGELRIQMQSNAMTFFDS
jgi:TatD DNase family protein